MVPPAAEAAVSWMTTLGSVPTAYPTTYNNAAMYDNPGGVSSNGRHSCQVAVAVSESGGIGGNGWMLDDVTGTVVLRPPESDPYDPSADVSIPYSRHVAEDGRGGRCTTALEMHTSGVGDGVGCDRRSALVHPEPMSVDQRSHAADGRSEGGVEESRFCVTSVSPAYATCEDDTSKGFEQQRSSIKSTDLLIYTSPKDIGGRPCQVSVYQASREDYSTSFEIEPLAPHPSSSSSLYPSSCSQSWATQSSVAGSGSNIGYHMQKHHMWMSATYVIGLFRIHVKDGEELISDAPDAARRRAVILVDMITEKICSQTVREQGYGHAGGGGGEATVVRRLWYCVSGKRNGVYCESDGEVIDTVVITESAATGSETGARDDVSLHWSQSEIVDARR